MKTTRIALTVSILALGLSSAFAESTPGTPSVTTVGGQRITAANQPALQWSTWLPTPAALALASAPSTPATPTAPLQREPSARKTPNVVTAAIPMTPANPALRGGMHH